jgi:hypothetical protein
MDLDSSLVEDALLAVLLNDSTVQTLAPDGVWWDAAGEVQGKAPTRYVIVSLIDEIDVGTFGGRGAEDYLFLVKAVMLNATSVDMRAIAQRFDTLLDDQQLTIPGYAFADMYRDKRVRFTEEDAENPAIRWLHRGGQYRVHVGIPTDVSHARAVRPLGEVTTGSYTRE